MKLQRWWFPPCFLSACIIKIKDICLKRHQDIKFRFVTSQTSHRPNIFNMSQAFTSPDFKDEEPATATAPTSNGFCHQKIFLSMWALHLEYVKQSPTGTLFSFCFSGCTQWWHETSHLISTHSALCFEIEHLFFLWCWIQQSIFVSPLWRRSSRVDPLTNNLRLESFLREQICEDILNYSSLLKW